MIPRFIAASLFAVTTFAPHVSGGADDAPWPPPLRGAVKGTVTLQTGEFLKVPESVEAKRKEGKIVAFDVAKAPPAFDRTHDYVPAGTYGINVSADGATIFVNFNGHAGDRIRPAKMKPNGFGLPAFAAIHLPASER